jgi:hypothetical protein
MKYIKQYEDLEYDVNVGDTLYCINNNGVERELDLGGKYTVDSVRNDNALGPIFRLAETQSRWMRFRFTPDPNHIIIAKHNAKKYNL